MFSWTRHRRILPSVRLVTSVWPSICGWKAVENCSVVPIRRHRVFQKLLVKRTSQSKTMQRGMPWTRTISLKKILAVRGASMVLAQGTKCVILLKRSTTTNIESCCFQVRGKPRTKSKLTSCHGYSRTGSGRYCPADCFVIFPTTQVVQRPIRRRVSRRRRG